MPQKIISSLAWNEPSKSTTGIPGMLDIYLPSGRVFTLSWPVVHPCDLLSRVQNKQWALFLGRPNLTSADVCTRETSNQITFSISHRMHNKCQFQGLMQIFADTLIFRSHSHIFFPLHTNDFLPSLRCSLENKSSPFRIKVLELSINVFL
jgi:hypothetical protein